jgi:hypothetical protein
MVYGDEVEVAVPVENNSTEWQAKKLKEVQPFYWRKPFMKLASGSKVIHYGAPLSYFMIKI